MGKQELDNLVQIGKLKAEAASRKELDGMPASARRGLVDVQNESIETDSRINRSRPEERALARVSKDGHKRDRASSHPSRRRFAPPQDEVCGFKLHPPDPIGLMESIDWPISSAAPKIWKGRSES
jgi:hypothetical protein